MSVNSPRALPKCCKLAVADLESAMSHSCRMAVHEVYNPPAFHGARTSVEIIEAHIRYCLARINSGWKYELNRDTGCWSLKKP